MTLAELAATAADIVDTYPFWATVSRAVVLVGLAMWLTVLGLWVRGTVRRARAFLLAGGDVDSIGGDNGE